MVTQEIAVNIARSFVRECELNGLTFYKVLIFGSVAKNMIHEWSDIDLLLISDQFGENVFENLKLYSKVNIKYPNIETHPYPIKYYRKGNAFFDDISKESIQII